MFVWTISIYLITTLVKQATLQKYEGDICELDFIGTPGTCVPSDACESAKLNYEKNGIRPKFCQYSAFGTSLVCCKAGQSLLKAPEPTTLAPSTKPSPSPSPLRSQDDETRRPAARKGDAEGDSCVEEYTGTLGTCTPLNVCHSAKLNHEKNGIWPTFCQFNAFGESLVCCKDGKTILQTSKPKTADPKPLVIYENDNRRVSERKCDAYSAQVMQRVDVYVSSLVHSGGLSVIANKCKYTSLDLIIGGEDADRGEFPHMAAIGWANLEGGYNFNCAGSLISTKFVLTAAHCSSDPRAYVRTPAVVRLADQNIDPRVNDGAEPIDVPIRHIHVHPGYKPPLKYKDIALLELATDLQFEDAVRPACLWTSDGFGDNDNGIATGWGVVDPGTRETAKELQKVSLSLLENDFCDDLLKHTWNRKWKGFAPEQMCAGELRGGKDTCQGDSGSPLQVTSKDNRCIFYVMGITSFGKKCGEAGQPAIYTRVSSYLDWIESIVWPGE